LTCFWAGDILAGNEKIKAIAMIKKILIPIAGDDVAHRFDLATEVLVIIVSSKNSEIEEERTIVLPRASAEKLCHLILTEHIHVVICGAIEDEFYQFLRWKQVTVFDAVIATWQDAFDAFLKNSLRSGDILYTRMVEGKHV
jgi:predicted Fe-Mo cluster-binding NifX family protein